jgi:hypothetical protein
MRLLTQEEYILEQAKREAMFCEAKVKIPKHGYKHEWEHIYPEERVEVKITGQFGEATSTKILTDVRKCVICGETGSYNDYMPDMGGCFIATAAYGSSLAPQLDVLRSFRDKCLPKQVTNTYYFLSPPIADYIRDKVHLRLGVRVALKPILRILRR